MDSAKQVQQRVDMAFTFKEVPLAKDECPDLRDLQAVSEVDKPAIRALARLVGMPIVSSSNKPGFLFGVSYERPHNYQSLDFEARGKLYFKKGEPSLLFTTRVDGLAGLKVALYLKAIAPDQVDKYQALLDEECGLDMSAYDSGSPTNNLSELVLISAEIARKQQELKVLTDKQSLLLGKPLTGEPKFSLERQLQEIKALPEVTNVLVVNNSIVVTYAEVVIQGVNLGRYTISVPLEAKDARELKFYSQKYSGSDTIHPHIKDKGACWGDADLTVKKLLAEKDFYGVATFMGEFLKSYNEKSPYKVPATFA